MSFRKSENPAKRSRLNTSIILTFPSHLLSNLFTWFDFTCFISARNTCKQLGQISHQSTSLPPHPIRIEDALSPFFSWSWNEGNFLTDRRLFDLQHRDPSCANANLTHNSKFSSSSFSSFASSSSSAAAATASHSSSVSGESETAGSGSTLRDNMTVTQSRKHPTQWLVSCRAELAECVVWLSSSSSKYSVVSSPLPPSIRIHSLHLFGPLCFDDSFNAHEIASPHDCPYQLTGVNGICVPHAIAENPSRYPYFFVRRLFDLGGCWSPAPSLISRLAHTYLGTLHSLILTEDPYDLLTRMGIWPFTGLFVDTEAIIREGNEQRLTQVVTLDEWINAEEKTVDGQIQVPIRWKRRKESATEAGEEQQTPEGGKQEEEKEEQEEEEEEEVDDSIYYLRSVPESDLCGRYLLLPHLKHLSFPSIFLKDERSIHQFHWLLKRPGLESLKFTLNRRTGWIPIPETRRENLGRSLYPSPFTFISSPLLCSSLRHLSINITYKWRNFPRLTADINAEESEREPNREWTVSIAEAALRGMPKLERLELGNEDLTREWQQRLEQRNRRVATKIGTKKSKYC